MTVRGGGGGGGGDSKGSFYLHLPTDRSEMQLRGTKSARGTMDYWIDPPLSYFSFQPVLHDWCNKG